MPTLTDDDLTTACRVVLEAYTREELERVIRERLNFRLEWAVANAGLEDQIPQLLDYCGRHRLTGRFLRAAADYPPPTPLKGRLAPLAARYPPEPEEPPRPTGELVRGAVVGFEAVRPLLADAAVRSALEPFTDTYRSAATHIDRLRRYKALHHCLHTIQLQYEEITRATKAMADEAWEAGSLDGYADVLDVSVTEVSDQFIPGLPNPAPEVTWVRNLRRAIEQLREAARSAMPGPAEEALRLIGRALNRDPIRIHALLVSEFEEIRLPGLVFSLRAIGRAVTDPGGRERVTDGLTHLEAVQLRLGRLVVEHTAWQNLDNSLRVALGSWYDWLSADRRAARARQTALVGAGGGSAGAADESAVWGGRLVEDWPDVAEKFAAVRGCAGPARRLERLESYAARLQEAARVADYDGVFKAFAPFSQLMLRRFVEVDRDLLTFADDLTQIGNPIQAILEEFHP